ncbi:MAG: Dabb family protein [Acidobacteriota bacterium]|nr:Dabb family protein [Acidobacteriota bacterium]
MIAHIVLFQPKPDLSATDRRAFVDALREAFASIPAIRRVRLGIRRTHGAAYEAVTTHDLTIGAVLEFDDLNALQAYLDHPAHQDLGARFRASAAVSWVYDYEMSDLDGLEDLLGRMIDDDRSR